MTDEQKVILRLERIATLRRAEAAEGPLLAELRGLLRDGEAWLARGDEPRPGADAPAGSALPAGRHETGEVTRRL
jgi:hypothetical protein